MTMIPEKLEECPYCGQEVPVHSWHYDAQYCELCGYNGMVTTLKSMQDSVLASHPYPAITEFHNTYRLPSPSKPQHPDEIDLKDWDLRMNLIEEEYNELLKAWTDRNIIEILDGLADLIYVCYGMAIHFGWPINEVFMEVQRSNMSKLGADGKPIIREDGKILKGPNFTRPDIAKIWIDAYVEKKDGN